jgi:hypothetical protein
MTLTAQPAIGTLTILIAEDSPTQAERLKHVLQTNGYAVMAAVNGTQAIEMARQRRPSLIITDVMMPEMDGYELCSKIKSDPELASIPVILVTTLSDPHDVIRGLECRADNFIIKPYDEHSLLARIQFVMLNREMHAHDHASMGVEIHFNGRRHFITADRLQILNLLLSTYEAAIQRNQELTRAKSELRTANASLETTNKELEAFSYSVSHDLRTPLRAINGFTSIVLDESAQQLDENGKELLLRVQSACVRMGQLIDDLLSLSRVARCELSREQIDLGAMARSIVAELQKTEPPRNVAVHIADGLSANGDSRLLRVLLENLLGNAWKFTSKRSDAVIEFTAANKDGETIFCVRDNGAGFDMTYMEKMFGAFQRFHTAQEFPGTGIGLATCHRIVHRHGGRIWAQGTPGQGAAFFFTL